MTAWDGSSNQVVDLLDAPAGQQVGVEGRQVDGVVQGAGLALQVGIDALVGQDVGQVVAVTEPATAAAATVAKAAATVIANVEVVLVDDVSHPVVLGC